ncbi:hypothetical protein N7462_011626 [Penicillium macrosclerotiorum]|uniref:uncharacterized protein n=1 Tax=Penicillium macrosclerotiorum TaxID=303699 RepID=UPI0025487150|nr:uncharacterized protein N7462_011626 [Penicillium macrosclerotiorum]KAJ5662700.1 hypothetical protein N7462_011626 [Penicillium macrosclerotiorum]
MAQRQLSRTLPKNFTFPSLSTDEPRTPERPSRHVEVPPPPRHSFSSCRLPRVRVRSGTDVCERIDLDIFRFQGSQGTQDVPLPSIEVPQASAILGGSVPDESVNDDRFLAPPRQRMAFKTPPAQIRGTPFDSCDTEHPWPSWDQTPFVGSITRPDSACSNHSDSSIESIETFASRPSVGGSCTSNESDIFDHQFPLEFPKEAPMESPTLPKRLKVQRPQVLKDKSWTRDMDNHLWNTYQLYLQDPTITPFKMTPGSIPPLGVTSRVARRAKRTWEKKKLRFTQTLPTQPDNRSGSSTPKALDSPAQPLWPKSDAKTRGRLKLLCRRKFCISPHYQRMMQSRSPEPMADMLGVPSEPHIHAFADKSSTAYTTRDLGVSLASTYDPSPLTQLAEMSVPDESKADWFGKPLHTFSDTHVAEPSTVQFPAPHLRVEPYNIPPRLGSPFVYSTWGPGGSNRQVQDIPQSARRETVHVPGRRLRRNTHMDRTPRDSDDVFSSDVYGEKDPSEEEVQNRLETYLRDNKFQSMAHGRVRVRNRGATTTGAIGPKDVNQLFSPPSSLNSSTAEETTPNPKPSNPLLSLGGENIKRLGSPFRIEGVVKRRDGPSRFIRHAPSLSDPFSSGGLPSYAHPAINPSHIQEQVKPGVPTLQDPFEEGLSDAERIRRQILNMPSMRN